MEAVSAIIILQLDEISSIPFEISVACAKSSASVHTYSTKFCFILLISINSIYHYVFFSPAQAKAVVDGLYLLWSFPLALPPLVRGWFKKGTMRLGVEERVLSDCEMRDRGFNVSLKDHIVNIRIPLGKEGAKIKVNHNIFQFL